MRLPACASARCAAGNGRLGHVRERARARPKPCRRTAIFGSRASSRARSRVVTTIAGVAVGRVRLAAEGDRAALHAPAQLGEAFGGRMVDALVASSVAAVFLKPGAGTSNGSVMKRLRKALLSASACGTALAAQHDLVLLGGRCRASSATFSAVCSIEWRPSGSQPKLSITQSSALPVPPGPRGFG
jgi:hypothetical protein